VTTVTPRDFRSTTVQRFAFFFPFFFAAFFFLAMTLTPFPEISRCGSIGDTTPRHAGIEFSHDPHWVDHMPDPGEFQAFRYGVHKALKSLQLRVGKTRRKHRLHLSILSGIWRHRKEDARRELMIHGAECVFSGKHPQLAENYVGDYAMRLMAEVKGTDVERYAPYWESDSAAEERVQALAHA